MYKIKIAFKFTILVLTIINSNAQSRVNSFVWQDSLGFIKPLDKYIDSFSINYISNKKPGLYIVYEGRERLEDFKFPVFDEGWGYDTFGLFENPMDRIKIEKDTCLPKKDLLPYGSWSKYLIFANGRHKKIKSKTINNGLLSGTWETSSTYENSRATLHYQDGFLTKIMRITNNELSMKGTYKECNKIIEETFWHNGKIWNVTKNNRMLIFDENGKLKEEIHTDDWGIPLR